MQMTIRVYGLAPICEGSDEMDITQADFTIDALDFGMGQFKAERAFRALGARYYPKSIKLVVA